MQRRSAKLMESTFEDKEKSQEKKTGIVTSDDMPLHILLNRDTFLCGDIVDVESDGSASLAPGMNPILEDLDLRTPWLIKPASMLKTSLAYTFTGDEPEGFYLVFLIITAADLDPGNQYNYFGVRMEPLFVQRIE